jgi:hypothetical protein
MIVLKALVTARFSGRLYVTSAGSTEETSNRCCYHAAGKCDMLTTALSRFMSLCKLCKTAVAVLKLHPHIAGDNYCSDAASASCLLTSMLACITALYLVIWVCERAVLPVMAPSLMVLLSVGECSSRGRADSVTRPTVGRLQRVSVVDRSTSEPACNSHCTNAWCHEVFPENGAASTVQRYVVKHKKRPQPR